MKSLLEAGVHFGHQVRRWDPRMRPYIFTQRNGIHIIDLQQTVVLMKKSYEFIRDTVADGGTVLFVGTKKQCQEAIEEEAKRSGMYFVNRRWLGGTLTNFRTVQSRIDYLVRLEDRKSRGELDRLPKKESSKLEREMNHMNRIFGGIKEMVALPSLLFIIDPSRERNAVIESRKLAVPVVAVVDTNCNPDEIDYIIPANDDAIKAVKLLCNIVAEAVLEGKAIRAGRLKEEEAAKTEDAGQEAPLQPAAVKVSATPNVAQKEA
ncbi:MAG: 30S ribosomal protein S2 [Dehalococcoidia bacterium]|nr:30S ribosomal protein S2 [Dehalococcoidia bacterium]